MRSSRQLDLLEQFHGSFTHVFATTYSIEPHFLDAYLLQHVELFADAERICIFVDADMYEQKFVSGQYRSPCINRQYFVHPVRCVGAFHPKVLLAISEKQARLFIGSANLTRDGLTRSIELIDMWDYRASEADEAPTVFVKTLNFLGRTLQIYPSTTASEMLDEACSVLPNLRASSPVQVKAETILTSLDSPILEQLQQLVSDAGDQIETLSVVSPFFDQNSNLLSQVLARLKPQRIDVYLQNDHSNVPIQEWIHWARNHPDRLQTFAVSFDETEKRFLHAKCIVASGHRNEWLLFGSPNFTTAALNAGYRNGNIEIAVLKVVPRRRQPLLTQLFGGYVTTTPIDLHQITAIQPEPPKFTAVPPSWSIREARLVHHKIELHVSRPSEEAPLPKARLWSQGTEQTVLHVTEDRGTQLLTEVVPHEERLFRSPVLVQLVTLSDEPASNAVFVEALIDRTTGEISRARRLLRQAQRSNTGFEMALQKLAADGDQEALIEFFWFVNIPLLQYAPSYIFRPSGGEIVPGGLVRREAIPFQWQIDLNQAIDIFWKRHIRKLRKHAETPMLTGVTNFLRILGCLQRALEYQQCVLIENLRSTSLLRNDDWYNARTLMDAILNRYRELADLMWNLYWPALRKRCRTKQACDALKNGLAEMRRGYDGVLQWYREVEDTRRACKVVTPYGKVEAQYFSGNIPQKWSNYENSLQSSVGKLLHALEAA